MCFETWGSLLTSLRWRDFRYIQLISSRLFCFPRFFPVSGSPMHPKAKLLGVWPPTDTTTPRGLSNSAMSMTFSWLNLWQRPWSIAVSGSLFLVGSVICNHPIGSIYHLNTTYSPCHMMGYLGKFYLQKHDGISWQILPTKTWWGCFSKLFGPPIRSHTNGKKILHQFKTS